MCRLSIYIYQLVIC